MPFQCVERFARATTVAFTEHLCASASASGRRVRVWERESGREILLLDKLRYMYTCFLTPDESACVVCGTVNTVLLCSLGEEKSAVQKIVLKGDEGPDAACCLAPDGSALYYPMTTGSLGTQVLKIDVRSVRCAPCARRKPWCGGFPGFPSGSNTCCSASTARGNRIISSGSKTIGSICARAFSCRKTRAVRCTSSMAAAACTRSAEQKRPWANTTWKAASRARCHCLPPLTRFPSQGKSPARSVSAHGNSPYPPVRQRAKPALCSHQQRGLRPVHARWRAARRAKAGIWLFAPGAVWARFARQPVFRRRGTAAPGQITIKRRRVCFSRRRKQILHRAREAELLIIPAAGRETAVHLAQALALEAKDQVAAAIRAEYCKVAAASRVFRRPRRWARPQRGQGPVYRAAIPPVWIPHIHLIHPFTATRRSLHTMPPGERGFRARGAALCLSLQI